MAVTSMTVSVTGGSVPVGTVLRTLRDVMVSSSALMALMRRTAQPVGELSSDVTGRGTASTWPMSVIRS